MNIDNRKDRTGEDAFWQELEITPPGETTRIPVSEIQRLSETDDNSADAATSTDTAASTQYRSASDNTTKPAKSRSVSGSASGRRQSARTSSNNSNNKKKGKKKGSGLTSLVRSSASLTHKTVSAGGSLLKGSARLTGSAARSGLKLVTLALIALTMALLVFHFWKNYPALGSLRTMAGERNYSLAAYLCVGILLLLFELIALLRASSSKKVLDHGRVYTYDTGRGLLSFPIIYAGSRLAGSLCERIPLRHPALTGVQSALRVYGSLSQTLFAIGCLGVVCCLLRFGLAKLLLSMRNHDDSE